MEPVNQEDRIQGAASIRGDDPKARAIRDKILRGHADDHPSVRAGADYRELSRLTPEQHDRLFRSTFRN